MSEIVNHAPSLELVTSRFQSDISTVDTSCTFQLPDLADAINHNAKYVQVPLDLEQGIYLDDGLYRTETSYGFYTQNANRLTREDSHNTVFFGSLVMIPQGHDPEMHAQVAIKSRPTHEMAKLTGEMALFQKIGSLGMKTFRPAGLLVGEQATHLMTYFEGTVATMDTIEWQDATPEEARLELDKVVDTMYQLHTNKLFHGDLEFRNVAFNHRGETVIIDPELMISGQELFEQLDGADIMLDDDQKIAYNALVRKLSIEFSAVCKSIDRHILPLLPKRDRPRTDEARLKLYKEYIFEPYKHQIREAQEPVRSILLRVYDEVLLRKKAQAKEQHL